MKKATSHKTFSKSKENIFQVEERESGRIPARHTFQYTDVLIGQVKIEELDGAPTVNLLNQK